MCVCVCARPCFDGLINLCHVVLNMSQELDLTVDLNAASAAPEE